MADGCPKDLKDKKENWCTKRPKKKTIELMNQGSLPERWRRGAELNW